MHETMNHNMSGQWLCRGDCGDWPTYLIILYITSNILIWLSYMAIPASIAIFWWVPKLRLNHGPVSMPFWQMICWILFIMSCGFGHLFDEVLAFVWPNYYFIAAWHCLTAIFSIITAVTFPLYAIRKGMIE